MQNKFTKIAKVSLVLVYLVIVAGAVVRMTGSGMGCPDWPKCFGYYIPPTDISELQWQPEKEFKKGQVIIVDEALWVAKENFSTATKYNADHWERYTKHDYAIFNPFHTWTEFINRLFGALAGLGTLIMAIASFSYWKKRKSITIFSWVVVFAMGFQAWLGATVVYSVLAPAKITIHMVMALVIVALILYLINVTGNKIKSQKSDKITRNFIILVLTTTLVQIVLGTQVRQFVDVQTDLYGENAPNLWLTDATLSFYIHRTFSIIVVLLNLFLAIRIYKLNLGYSKINWVLGLLLLEIISGMAMYYLDFPFTTQPLHLVLASILFGFQFYLVLEAINAFKTIKTL
ncbi:heme A synthase [Arenibacter sp. TNZ]|jgi:cytochrome c oxidase assembly protein subunit 15|uniref:COX15/CtaA family protein n=1 Tax=Arenibacter TaxID=178469 RepID=UPI000CD41AFC|nr:MULTISPECIES: COX15/CtaA family protein [Arenibacter]MCM4170593.1 heme A synthase [Arenibacter sp. TNZ]